MEMIDVMYAQMKVFINWPDRSELHKTMPMQFRKHFGKKVTVIIDCFEVFLDRPIYLPGHKHGQHISTTIPSNF